MSWLRRNALALGVLVVLLGASAAIVGGVPWRAYHGASDAIVVDGTATLAGATFSDGRLEPLPGDSDVEVAPGAEGLVFVVDVDPGDTPPLCLPPLLREQAGAGREWSVRPTYWSDPDRTTGCRSDVDAPYTIATPFVVPAGTGPVFVDLRVAEEGSFLRFAFDR